MKRKLLAVAVAGLFSLSALADGGASSNPYAGDGEIYGGATSLPLQSAKSREQARAEVIARHQSGDYFIANTGLKAYQLWPSLYPQPAPAAAGKTRDEVIAEVVEAKRSGEFVVDGELGLTAKRVFPNAYPQQVLASGEQKSRM